MRLSVRLALGLTVSLVLLLTLQWVLASIVIRHLAEDQVLIRLQQDAESLLSGVDIEADGRMVLDKARINTSYQRPFSGHYYSISSAGQGLLSRSLWDSELAVAELNPGVTVHFKASGPQQQPLLVLVQGYRKHGRNISIAVAEDTSKLRAGMQQFQILNGTLSLLVLLLLLLLQYRIVSTGLRPLMNLRGDMAKLQRGETDRVSSAAPAEIAPVINELNRLLATMGKRSKRSREALGNLAHALNTRLAALNQLADAPALAEHAELRVAITDTSEAMRRIVARELKRARLIGDTLPGRRVDLHGETGLLLQTLQLMYQGKPLYIDSQVAEDAHFAGDQEDLLEMLGNLMDNACKWCKHQVSLTILQQRGVRFIVEDDGPGCLPEEMEHLTSRGFRIDESKPGSGLGLAIVRDIVESYGGQLSFSRSERLGGLRVSVTMPERDADKF
ncbi:ATP-binding protein [Pseudomethylobacillus aquaticus]|nr:ATP-binding protein [Pseudomethylobacillus aquaticus]